MHTKLSRIHVPWIKVISIYPDNVHPKVCEQIANIKTFLDVSLLVGSAQSVQKVNWEFGRCRDNEECW